MLGTLVEISISADCGDQYLIDVSEQAFEVISSVHNTLSFHKPESELSLINQKAYYKPVRLSAMANKIFLFCQELYRDSEGLFDVSIAPLLINHLQLPQVKKFNGVQFQVDFSQVVIEDQWITYKKPLLIDLGGVAKGYAVDLAMAVIQKKLDRKLQQAYINAGGDIRFFDWYDQTIMVPDIKKKLCKVKMQQASVATSSTYYHHGKSVIYHPLSQQVVDFKKTVSVFASHCMVADALTKIAAHVSGQAAVFPLYEAQVIYT